MCCFFTKSQTNAGWLLLWSMAYNVLFKVTHSCTAVKLNNSASRQWTVGGMMSVLVVCSWRGTCKCGCRWCRTGSRRMFTQRAASWTVTCWPAGSNGSSSSWVRLKSSRLQQHSSTLCNARPRSGFAMCGLVLCHVVSQQQCYAAVDQK